MECVPNGTREVGLGVEINDTTFGVESFLGKDVIDKQTKACLGICVRDEIKVETKKKNIYICRI